MFTSRKLYLTGDLFLLGGGGGGGSVEGVNKVVGSVIGMAHYMCGVPLGLDRQLAPLYIYDQGAGALGANIGPKGAVSAEQRASLAVDGRCPKPKQQGGLHCLHSQV